MPYVRVDLPQDIASELVADEVAVPPVDLRGGEAFQIAHYVVDGINTGQATVTLVLTGVALRKLAQRTLARIRSANNTVTVKLTVDDEVAEFVSPSDASDLEDRLLAFLVEHLKNVDARG